MTVKHLKMDVRDVSDALEEVHVKITEEDILIEQNLNKAIDNSVNEGSIVST